MLCKLLIIFCVQECGKAIFQKKAKLSSFPNKHFIKACWFQIVCSSNYLHWFVYFFCVGSSKNYNINIYNIITSQITDDKMSPLSSSITPIFVTKFKCDYKPSHNKNTIWSLFLRAQRPFTPSTPHPPIVKRTYLEFENFKPLQYNLLKLWRSKIL